MAQELPKLIDIDRLDGPAAYTGTVQPGYISRLESPYVAAQPIHVELAILPNTEQGARLTGTVKTSLEAICQRCLEKMTFELVREFDAVTAKAPPLEVAEDNTDDFVVTQDGVLAVREFVEDELLLGCPMIPVHDTDSCRAKQESKESERRKPFAGLGDLLAGKDEKTSRGK